VPANADVVSYYTTFAPLSIAPSARFTVAIPRGNKAGQEDGVAVDKWDAEELVAMQFAYVRALAEDAAGERVHDVVVTVPPFYAQFERDAIADAVELAGLRLLALVNDGAAVAVNYAMTRQFPQPERHVVYDAGAASTCATVVTFSSQQQSAAAGGGWKKKEKDAGAATLITVGGVGYDRLAGGTELDRRLREILVEEFERKHGARVRDDPKAMMKLWKEAERIKGILSANTEASARVESVHNDIDFGMKVTRQAFEEIASDMKARFVQPIYDALDNANLTLVRCGFSPRRRHGANKSGVDLGGHRLGYFDGWGHAYTDGEGCAGSCRWRVCSPLCVCALFMTKPSLSGRNLP
jgi:hypoxia up-regulated 1